MSAHTGQEPERESQLGPTRRPRPPPITKPKPSKHNITNKVLQEAFEVEHYMIKTENWREIKITAAVRVLRVRIYTAFIPNLLDHFRAKYSSSRLTILMLLRHVVNNL
ncbi:hypothetical protein TWF281_011027 [Arthrobotrys megalospora]